MKVPVRLLLALAAAIALYLPLSGAAWEQRRQFRQATRADYVLPSEFSRVLALDYQGLLADYQLLRLMTFYGERIQYRQQLSPEDWRYVERSLDTITDLDPWFRDAYLLGESLLAWEKGKVEAANELLLKGMKYLPDFWRFPFFIGANHLLFLRDYEAASEYLKLAAEMPNSPSFLPTLAARLDYYAGKSKVAVLFLKQLLEETADPQVRARLETRLTALERATLIEGALEEYRQKYGGPPGKLEELVAEGFLEELPEDPYGGRWVILDTGRVYSTSRFAEPAAGDTATPLPVPGT